MMKKAKVFIEGSNVYFAQKKMGAWLDWVKVKQHLNIHHEIIELRYYAGRRQQDTQVDRFLKKLRTIGFTVVTKTVKTIVDEGGRTIEKANFDVEMTMDILHSLSSIDTVVLFSGDSDFAPLVKAIRSQRKEVVIFSSRKTLSWELKLCAHNYFFFEDLSQLTKGEAFVRM